MTKLNLKEVQKVMHPVSFAYLQKWRSKDPKENFWELHRYVSGEYRIILVILHGGGWNNEISPEELGSRSLGERLVSRIVNEKERLNFLERVHRQAEARRRWQDAKNNRQESGL